MSYQRDDEQIIDYRASTLTDIAQLVRGPLPPEDDGPFVCCLGAAQTFGRYVEKPWPMLLAERVGVACANFGFGGATPGRMLASETIRGALRRAALVILQVPSARNYPNSLLRPSEGGWQVRLNGAWQAVPGAARGFRLLRDSGREPDFRLAVGESRAAWTEDMLRILGEAAGPTILLWFARRTPRQKRGFPQLVREPQMERIRGAATRYVEVVSKRGDPHYPTNRFDGQPLADPSQPGERLCNWYYPTPEMHEDAAAAVHAALKAEPELNSGLER